MTNIFGTDGIRARIGSSPFTPTHLPLLGHAIAQWIIETYGSHALCIIGTDSRESGDWISATLKSSLLQYPLTIHELGVVPTPAFLHYMQTHSYAACALIISASHNLYHDNGIKILDKQSKLSAAAEQRISQLFYQASTPLFGTQFGKTYYRADAAASYQALLMQKSSALSLCGKKIIVDCAHGATSTIAPGVLQATGAQIIAINCTPNGRNINELCGATHITSLQSAMAYYHADIGFAFDGDGDRISIVSPQSTVLDGDDILTLLAQHPAYAQQPALVSTIMSNQGLSAWLAHRNQQLIRTSVGDKYITQVLTQQNLLLGGEPSGHIIMTDYMPISDSIAAAVRLLETIALTNNWQLTTFKKFPQYSKNIPVKEKKNLEQEPLAPLIDASKTQLTNGRLVIRYSGTEPLLRIMAEGEHAHETESIVQQLSEQLYRLLN